jgi:hypothetical protein
MRLIYFCSVYINIVGDLGYLLKSDMLNLLRILIATESDEKLKNIMRIAQKLKNHKNSYFYVIV